MAHVPDYPVLHGIRKCAGDKSNARNGVPVSNLELDFATSRVKAWKVLPNAHELHFHFPRECL